MVGFKLTDYQLRYYFILANIFNNETVAYEIAKCLSVIPSKEHIYVDSESSMPSNTAPCCLSKDDMMIATSETNNINIWDVKKIHICTIKKL
jgi:hypothetical protein